MFDGNTCLGIDLRSENLRLAYLRKEKDAVRLLAYESANLPSSSEGLAEYETACINTLRKFISQNKVDTDNIILGLPQKDAIFRRVNIPSVDKEDLRQILEFEVEKHIPFALKDIYFDYQILQHLEENKLDVFFAAVKKETLNYILSLFKMAEITYSRLELNTYALFACLDFQKNSKEKDINYIVVDVDKNDVEIAVVANRRLIFSHTFNKRAPDTANMANLNKEVSEEIRGIIKSADIASLKLAENLRQEIHFLLISLSKMSQLSDVKRIYLSGAHITPDVIKYIQATVRIDTVLIDPLQNIASCAFAEPPLDAATAIGLALEGLGLVLPGLNILPTEEQRVKKDKSFLIPMALGALLFISLSGTITSYFLKDRLALKKLDRQIEVLQPQIQVIEKKSEEYNNLMSQLNNLNKISREPVAVLDVLKELTIIIPTDVWLDRFKMGKNEIEIGGYASSASSLIPILEESPLFKNVKFTSTITSGKEGKEQFQIKMELAI